MKYRDRKGELHDPWRYPEICGSPTCAICGEGERGETWAQRYKATVDLVEEK